VTSHLIRLGDAASQFFNVLIFDGDPNHSISGDAFRFGRRRLSACIDLLFSPFETEHCRAAYENDVRKAIKLVEEHSYKISNVL
jgi:hypothetical protein